MAEKTQKLQFVIDAENRAKRVFQDAEKEISRFEGKLNNLQPAFKKMAKVGTVALTGIIAGIGSMVKQAAKMETLEVSFETMLGSAEKAQETLKDLTDFTSRTPFQFDGVAKSARQLLSFGVEAKDVKEKLQFLGDIAAGANIPLNEMASIFGKSMAKGKAMTEELLQLSDRGVPIIKVLAEQLGVTGEEIFDMASKGQISFDILQTALKSMSDEGGIFFDLMNKQSQTLEGRISTLKDNFQLLSIQLGKHFIPIVGDMVEKAMEAVKTFNDWTEKNPETAATIIKVGLAVAGVVTALGFLGLIVPKVIVMVKLLMVAINPLVGVIIAIGSALVILANLWKKISDEKSKAASEIAKSAAEMDQATAKLIEAAKKEGDLAKVKQLQKDQVERQLAESKALFQQSLSPLDEVRQNFGIRPGGIFNPRVQVQSGARETESRQETKVVKFDFSGLNVLDKDQFIGLVKGAINREAELELVSGQ